MNNYYEVSLAEIQQAINENDLNRALSLLDEELRMPYIPEPYHTTFQALRDSIRIDNAPLSKYFDSMDEIVDALKGNDALKHKALISLERMNLRSEMTSITDILMDRYIDEWMKRQILLFLIEQDIRIKIDAVFNSQVISLDLSKLENPIGSQEYLDAYKWLQEELESSNPSLLILCIAELDQLVLENFPISTQEISGPFVLNRVRGYLNAV